MSTRSIYDVGSFQEFWPHYVRLHARPATQIAHAVATTTFATLAAIALARRRPVLLLLAPLADFVIAQASHRRFEKNVTTPWRRPHWHARAELRMLRRVLTGRMKDEVRRHTARAVRDGEG